MKHKTYGEVRVAQYTKDGYLVKIWDSQTEASEATGVPQSYISHCCYGRMKLAGGFKWSFI